jgi:O-antigen/teichoic acid export membrane protein
VNPLKKLASQTAIYGLSTIFPRFLNYLLTPLLTYIFEKPVDFGVNTEIYAYISFMNILFTYGMETAFFNFASKSDEKDRVYSAALISILASTASLSLLFLLFSGSIAEATGYTNHLNFIIWSIFIIASDAVMAIPFARLRLNGNAKKFALVKMVNVFLNVFLNVFYFIVCKNAFEAGETSIYAQLYNPEIGIGYSFLANLFANLLSLLLLAKEFSGFQYVFDKELCGVISNLSFKRSKVFFIPLV